MASVVVLQLGQMLLIVIEVVHDARRATFVASEFRQHL
jgi:hypothetical protein